MSLGFCILPSLYVIPTLLVVLFKYNLHVNVYTYHSLVKKGPVSISTVIGSISCKGLKFTPKAPTQLTSCRGEIFQMQHDARLVYSYAENDVM